MNPQELANGIVNREQHAPLPIAILIRTLILVTFLGGCNAGNDTAQEDTINRDSTEVTIHNAENEEDTAPEGTCCTYGLNTKVLGYIGDEPTFLDIDNRKVFGLENPELIPLLDKNITPIFISNNAKGFIVQIQNIEYLIIRYNNFDARIIQLKYSRNKYSVFSTNIESNVFAYTTEDFHSAIIDAREREEVWHLIDGYNPVVVGSKIFHTFPHAEDDVGTLMNIVSYDINNGLTDSIYEGIRHVDLVVTRDGRYIIGYFFNVNNSCRTIYDVANQIHINVDYRTDNQNECERYYNHIYRISLKELILYKTHPYDHDAIRVLLQ